MAQIENRLGVDIGGTFTDVVLETAGGAFSTKVLTTYDAPERAILDGMRQVCARAAIAPADIGQIIHGTTLATNALIERRGAKTALVTTEGFRDVIEMRTESRFEQYDLNLQLPEPLLPRQMRFTVPERIDAEGGILVPLDEKATHDIAERIAGTRAQSIAIGLIHSYANPDHERRVADILASRMPEATISLSSEVSPQIREYERFNTVIANAYVKPLMKSYLGRLRGRLADVGATCDVFLMHSGGGIMSLTDAAEFPVRLVESGPAGGAVFAAHIAARHGVSRVLSFDMGGTTAKICLIRDGAPKTARVFEVARSYRFKKGSGMPISIPVIDMVEIGAGGGSLAHIDGMRQIRVGPESAGSEPGPACYGHGGTRPAVTDADLVLGRLDADAFAGGTMTLDTGAGSTALIDTLGEPLNMDAQTAAFGLSEVVDENMANAARVHAVENGEDLAQYTMIAFGGAAPLHAARLCEKLGIARLLVPQGAGVGSAIGFLRAPFAFEATRSVHTRLSDFDSGKVAALLDELRAEARDFVRSCDAEADTIAEVKAFMRYAGQGWEIPITLSPEDAANPDPDTFRSLFNDVYARLFARTVEGLDVEITLWSVNVATIVPPADPLGETPESTPAKPRGTRDIFDPALSATVKASIVRRADMTPGQTIEGPAATTEDETTVIIPSSRRAILRSDGTLDITPKATQ